MQSDVAVASLSHPCAQASAASSAAGGGLRQYLLGILGGAIETFDAQLLGVEKIFVYSRPSHPPDCLLLLKVCSDPPVDPLGHSEGEDVVQSEGDVFCDFPSVNMVDGGYTDVSAVTHLVSHMQRKHGVNTPIRVVAVVPDECNANDKPRFPGKNCAKNWNEVSVSYVLWSIRTVGLIYSLVVALALRIRSLDISNPHQIND